MCSAVLTNKCTLIFPRVPILVKIKYKEKTNYPSSNSG